MAYTEGNLFAQINAPPGRMRYRYDTEDHPDVVEDAGYFNNLDDDLNLQKGDELLAVTWSDTPFEAASTISQVKAFMVTNVIANDAAASAGAVNIAEILISTAGALSSGT